MRAARRPYSPISRESMDGLSDAEAMIVTGLMRECKEHERRDTFFPAFAGCSVCGGRIYAQTTDVAKQLGVCGCAVAFEMEYGAATARCAVTAPSPYQEPSKEAQLALLTVDFDRPPHQLATFGEPHTPPAHPPRKAKGGRGVGRTKPRAPRRRPRAILK